MVRTSLGPSGLWFDASLKFVLITNRRIPSKMTHRVTLRDIGKTAGVHHTTVSLALRNHPSLPEATRARIRAIADDMGYRPDPVLSALNAYKTSRKREVATAKIAVVTNIPDLGDPSFDLDFFSRTLMGARRKAQGHGYDLDLFNMAEQSLSSQRLETVLRTRNIQGVILAYFRDNTLIEFDWSEFSAIKIEDLPRDQKLNVVRTSQLQAAELALTTLKAKGYRRVASMLNTESDQKLGNYYSAGIKAFNDVFEPADRIAPLYFSDFEELERSLPGYLEEARPDAIVSDWNDAIIDLLRRHGRSVPEDVGFASLSLPREGHGMSGVLPAYEKVGELAVDFVAQMLRGNERGLPDRPFHAFVDGAWVDGATLKG